MAGRTDTDVRNVINAVKRFKSKHSRQPWFVRVSPGSVGDDLGLVVIHRPGMADSVPSEFSGIAVLPVSQTL